MRDCASGQSSLTQAYDLREHLADLHRSDGLHRVADEPHLTPSHGSRRRT
jgi:hypothetical protein